MMVSNHFDVRWVDGYSAVSDVPSSLAAMIEKMAAELPSSHDRIELAVRDLRRPDGALVCVGLLRFVVAVSSAPRPLGYLHATVLPGGYSLDLAGWRALVARRYGGHPEERIRSLYEELAESTRDSGRDRLHALAVRPEDVRELLEPLDETERTPIPRPARPPTIRPPSKPPVNRIVMPPPGAGPKLRPSQPALSMSVRTIGLPAPTPAPPSVEDLPKDADPDGDPELANDITQPMDAPSGTAAPLSGEHPQQVRPVERPRRVWWVAGAVLGALALLLGAVGWMAHRHRLLVDERDRLASELSKKHPDQDAWDRDRKKLEEELAQAKNNTDQICKQHIEAETAKCKLSLKDVRDEARTKIEDADRALDDWRGRLAEANNRLTLLTRSKDEVEVRYRSASEEQRVAVEARNRLETENKQLRERYEQLKVLCKGLQSTRKYLKECQGI